MAIQNIPPAALEAYQKNQRQAPSQANEGKPTDNPANQLSEVTVRNEKQAVFVSHFFDQNGSKTEGALKITYKIAIDKINERLEAETGQKEAISEANLKKQGGMEYWSPEKVAQRIVTGTTAFLENYQKIHPELQGEALIDRFLSVISGGVQQGFKEAQGVLKDLDVFDGDVKDNYQKTLELVQKGFEAFRNQQLGLTEEAQPTSTQTASEEAKKETEQQP